MTQRRTCIRKGSSELQLVVSGSIATAESARQHVVSVPPTSCSRRQASRVVYVQTVFHLCRQLQLRVEARRSVRAPRVPAREAALLPPRPAPRRRPRRSRRRRRRPRRRRSRRRRASTTRRSGSRAARRSSTETTAVCRATAAPRGRERAREAGGGAVRARRGARPRQHGEPHVCSGQTQSATTRTRREVGVEEGGRKRADGDWVDRLIGHDRERRNPCERRRGRLSYRRQPGAATTTTGSDHYNPDSSGIELPLNALRGGFFLFQICWGFIYNNAIRRPRPRGR